MVDIIKTSVMTATAAATAAETGKDQELISYGLVESASVNAFADFIPSKLNESQLNTDKEKDDFKNTFICHLIFYVIFCISLVFYILIDLGLGSFIKNKFLQFLQLGKKTVFEKSPAFA